MDYELRQGLRRLDLGLKELDFRQKQLSAKRSATSPTSCVCAGIAPGSGYRPSKILGAGWNVLAAPVRQKLARLGLGYSAEAL